MPDKAWKKLERRIGKLLHGERVKRMGDYSQSATDVIVGDLPQLKIDCKLRRRFAHHQIFLDIRTEGKERPLLVTREGPVGPALVNFEVEHFAEILAAVRKGVRPRPARWHEHLAERPRFKHHALFREVRDRYCRTPGDVPLLITKEHRKQTYLVTIEAELFDRLRRGQNSFFGVLPISSRTASAAGLDS
jgi:hypothetical protein